MKRITNFLLTFIFMFIMIMNVDAIQVRTYHSEGLTSPNGYEYTPYPAGVEDSSKASISYILENGSTQAINWENSNKYYYLESTTGTPIFCLDPEKEVWGGTGYYESGSGNVCGIIKGLENGTITTDDLDLIKASKTASTSNTYRASYKKVQNLIWKYKKYNSCASYAVTGKASEFTSDPVTRSFTVDSKVKMTLNSAGTHWVSSKISVGHTGIDTYTVSLASNGFLPSGTTVSTTPLGTDINGKTTSVDTLYVNVPVKSVTQKMDFYLKFSGSYLKSTTTRKTATTVTPSILKYSYTKSDGKVKQDIGTLTYVKTEGKTSTTPNYATAAPAQINLYSDSGSFNIIKVKGIREYINGQADIPIKGIEFKLFDNKNNPAKHINGTEVGTLVTDANGKITVNNLQYGTYRLVETKTLAGYVAMDQALEFTLEGPTNISFKNTNYHTLVGTNTIKIKNNQYPQSIIKKDIKDKEDKTATGIKGAEIRIYNASGKWMAINTKTVPSYFYLEPGDYTVKEITAPTGYEKLENTFKIKILDDGKIQIVEGDAKYISISGRDITIYNEGKSITISKKDMTTEDEVEGAEIVIRDKDNKEVEKFVSGKEPTKIVLKPGKYTMIETIAPVGYEKVETTFEFEVLEDRTIKLITVNNKYIELDENGGIVLYNQFKKIKISKKDITNEKEVEGAKIVIKDEKGNIKKEFISSKQPEEFELQPGIYLMTETIAPKGYQKVETVFKFQVLKDGSIKLLTVNDKSVKADKNHMTFYNNPEVKVKVPDTAKNIIIYGIIGLLLIGTGGILFFIKYRENNKIS